MAQQVSSPTETHYGEEGKIGQSWPHPYADGHVGGFARVQPPFQKDTGPASRASAALL